MTSPGAPRKIVIAGASGFLGTRLSAELVRRGHAVTALTRRPTSAPDESTWDPQAGTYDRDVIESADVVVNLAGSPLFGNVHGDRWARELRESRVGTTRLLARAIADSDRVPAFLAGNGSSWYGDHGSDPVTEDSESLGDAFMTRVTREWQAATEPAAAAGARVCLLRTAPVMDRRGGPVQILKPLFQLCLGARLGDGEQYFPVISMHDWVGAVTHLVEHDDAAGPVNLCSPATPTNAEFTSTLAAALNRRAFAFAPAPVLRLGLGPAAPELLRSLRMVPAALESAGYRFRDDTVRAVLHAALS